MYNIIFWRIHSQVSTTLLKLNVNSLFQIIKSIFLYMHHCHNDTKVMRVKNQKRNPAKCLGWSVLQK